MAMNGYGDTFSGTVQNFMIGDTGYTSYIPSLWYIGLGITSVLNSNATNWVEVSGIGYARARVYGYSSASTPKWTHCSIGSTPSPFTVYNETDVEFPTAGGSWGTVLCAAVWEHATSSTVAVLLFGGALVTSKNIAQDTTAVFLASQCRLSCNNAT